MLIFSRHRFCMTIRFRQSFPLFKQRRFCFNILESSFRSEIDNISVPTVVYRTDSVIRRSGIDTSRGLKGERIFFMFLLFACQHRFEAFSIHFRLRLSSCYVDKGRNNIDVFHQCITHACRLNHSRPADDTRRMYSRIITSPFGKRQAVALFAQIYDN